ncbi:hypothetical protein [Micropruina sonneratiae]|uniref:hypothetical protein n=1 Tax=Micropruina sonneratiae TaxID=2986940 RepID=UPI0022261FAC|nr:hypothetical protein [Micropruina sp. KQZ13P-5]MCW3158060.1 hypothetical protein [Micropruina sp. KQZ13P-5]
MLLPPTVAAGVRDGSVSLAFRRWRRPDVRPGQQFRTSAGVIRVESVETVDPASITESDAALAGHPSADSVRKRLSGEDGWTTYRIGLGWAGEDPRIALRSADELSDDDVAALDQRLERLDRASTHGAWTMATLELIGRRPQVRAPDLAAEFGRETAPFKLDVRKLKNLGLTISHPVGYELSPRGRAYLARTGRTG